MKDESKRVVKLNEFFGLLCLIEILVSDFQGLVSSLGMKDKNHEKIKIKLFTQLIKQIVIIYSFTIFISFVC